MRTSIIANRVRGSWLPILLLVTGLSAPGFGETVAARVETNNGFRPAQIVINTGDVVEWVNTSTMTHSVSTDVTLAKNPANVILPEGAVPFNSGALRPGDTFRHTFTVPGHYRYFCMQHEKFGMIGEITVR